MTLEAGVVAQSSGQISFSKPDSSEQDDIRFVFERLESKAALSG